MNAERAAGWALALCPGLNRAPLGRWLGSNLLGRLVRGTFWTVLGTCLTKILALVSSVLSARILGQQAFGELATIQSTSGLFGAVAGLGIGITATKYVAELRQTDPARCGRVIGLCVTAALAFGLGSSLVLWFCSDWLATRALAAAHLAPLLRWSIGLVVLGALQGTYLGLLAGFEAFKRTAWVNAITGFLGLPLVLVATLAAGLPGAVCGLVVQSALGCICGHWAMLEQAAQAQVKLSFAFGFHEWRLLTRFTLPAFCSCAVATPASWLTRTLLVNQPGGYFDVAVCGAAGQWMNLVTFLPWMMSGVLIPIFSDLHATHRRAEFSKLLRYNLWLNGAVALALALPLALLAARILGWYGPGFPAGVLIFELTMVTAFFNAFNGLLSRTMQSAGKAWMDLSSNVIWATVALSASWFLVRPYHGAGLAGAHALAALAWALCQWVLVWRVVISGPGQKSANTASC